VPKNPHADYGLDGVEIISNSSGSHHQLRKLDQRIVLIQNASARHGGIYLYSNLTGGDGGRLYFDGSSMIFMNGVSYAQAPQFSIDDVEVEVAVLDLDQVRAHRMANVSRGGQATQGKIFPRIQAKIEICRTVDSIA
jgi:NAD+ synthase (glutamine-hydrolysing)